jgi:hypothetical protein
LASYQYILYDINLANILAQRAYANSMATVAMHILHKDLRRVGFERHAIIAIINDGVLDRNIRGAVHIPSIRIFRIVLAEAVPAYIKRIEDDVR